VAWVVEDGDTRWVFVDGEVTTVEVSAGTARPSRRGAPDSQPTLSAPMPATVVRVVAPAGTRVQRGATIVLLEAMKMELPLRAPFDALVSAVHCRDGELVQPGTVLVELEQVS
jgi:biotin carboxyl carrier protein